jgi:hypothetical protein
MILLMLEPMTMVVMLLLIFNQVSKISSYLVILALHGNDWFLTMCFIMESFIAVIVVLPVKLSLVLFGGLLLLGLLLAARAYSWLHLPCHDLI